MTVPAAAFYHGLIEVKRQKFTVYANRYKHRERTGMTPKPCSSPGRHCMSPPPLQHVCPCPKRPVLRLNLSKKLGHPPAAIGSGTSSHCWTLMQFPPCSAHVRAAIPKPANILCLPASEIRLCRGEVWHECSFCNNKLVFPPILPGWHSNHRLSSLATIGGSQI